MRSAQRFKAILVPLVCAGGFVLLAWGIGQFDWGSGLERASFLLAALAVAFGLTKHPKSTIPLPPDWRMPIALLAIPLLSFHAQYCYEHALHAPTGALNLIDIGATTARASKLLISGDNPYCSDIDPHPDFKWGSFTFNGYKYGPVMPLVYMPLVARLGDSGILMTNLVLHVLVAAMTWLVAARVASPVHGAFAMVLYLCIPLLPSELFLKGVTDLAALLPLLMCLALGEQRSFLMGALTGISISTKLLPGAILAPLLIPNSSIGRLRYSIGVLSGLIPLAVASSVSPSEVVSNLVLFNLFRPSDSTSWLHTHPPSVSTACRIVFFASLLYLYFITWTRQVSLLERIRYALLAILMLLLSSPICHRNYQLWWLPMFAILVTVACSATEGSILGSAETTISIEGCSKPTSRGYKR
jgi:hypothetical protein